MIMPITNRFLLGNYLYPSSNYIIDTKNNILYKVYKVVQKENLNKLGEILQHFGDMILIFKTYNYYSEIFTNRIRQLIFKEFADIDFSTLTHEELEAKISGPLFEKYKKYDEIFKKFEQEINMRSKNLQPGRLIYLLIPIKLYVSDPKKVQDFVSLKNSIIANDQKMLKTINTMTFQAFNTYYTNQINNYKAIEKMATNLFIKPSTDINSTFIKSDSKQIEQLNAMLDIETGGNVIPVDKEEIDGLLNSFFYDSVYVSGSRFYNIFTLFTEQLKNMNDSEQFFTLMKILYNQYNTTVKINNSILKSFNKYNLLFFASSLRNLVDKDYNLLKVLDGINADIDVVIKLTAVKKDSVLNFLKKRLSEKILQMENLQKKEEELYEASLSSIEALQMEINHYRNLITRIGDEREKVYGISLYVLQSLLNQFVPLNLYDLFGRNGIDLKQLNPEANEYNILFDIARDKTISYIHTTPLLHYLNFYQPLTNSIIINEQDAERIKRMAGRTLGGVV